MLKVFRVFIATVFILAISALCLDFTQAASSYVGWSKSWQFVPAFLSLNIAMMIGLVLLTVLFGRVYCSTICPLGVLQDVLIRLTRNRKKRPFKYTPPPKWLLLLKYGFALCFAISLIVGISLVTGLLEPFSAFGRILSQIFSPLYLYINNILANYAEKHDSFSFYHKDLLINSLSVLVVTVLNLIFIVVLVWRKGRLYCNVFCPVGTVL
ncbi:MAG: 4Fe-4S binding protein, partial [Candidatus Cloacimonetes bacterium]|nr:4Fe-4S binding protein [Candidatus Cloacimonadota bacterium]